MSTQALNITVVVAYLAVIVGVGIYFSLRRKSADQFMTADRNMPAWAVGLSMFGSYVSSISFLANPSSAFKGNWRYTAFTLMTPIGLLVGTTLFMRFYRRTGNVSAYTHLEHRFGGWARSYAVFTFLIIQMARMGTILYLLSQAVLPLLGGNPATDFATARTLIVIIGLLITFYTLFGGIEAVVWTGVVQSVVLIAGPVICMIALLAKIPGGFSTIFHAGAAAGKFSLGDQSPSLIFDHAGAPGTSMIPGIEIFWLLALAGILEHLRNWGVDQSYIQRYITAKDEKAAARSIWLAGLLYIPVGLFFFFIGTSLWVFYQANPGALPVGTPPDSVFPHFISNELFAGLGGLVVAAIFAASMDSNLNSMATLTLIDGYKRYIRPNPTDKQSLRVLYGGTFFWGVMSMGYAFIMTFKGSTDTLKFTAQVVGLLSGGMLGLFLIGLLSRKVTSGIAALATTVGGLIIIWMTVSRWKIWPQDWMRLRSPLHEVAAGVVGTCAILLIAFLLAAFRKHNAPGADEDAVLEQSR